MPEIPAMTTGKVFTSNLSAPFFDCARRAPAKTAIVFGEQELSNADLIARVDAVIDKLKQLGFRRGQRVVYLGWNHPVVLITYFAVARLGGVFVPLNPRSTPVEAEVLLNDCGASIVFAGSEFQPMIDSIRESIQCQVFIGIDEGPDSWEVLAISDLKGDSSISRHPMVQTEPEETAMLLYTSGTTGRPKGVISSHGAVWATGYNMSRVLGLSRNTRLLAFAPMYHIGMLGTSMGTLAHGGLVVIHPEFDPAKVCEALSEWAINLVFAVPTILQAIESHPDFSAASVNDLAVVIGGAPVPVPIIKRWGDMDAHILQVYGLTEGGGTLLDFDKSLEKQGSAGLPMPLTQFQLRDIETGEVINESDRNGEIHMRGPAITSGYWNLPEQTEAVFDDENWFATGDIGRWDSEGYLYIVDRIKDMIISGGMNVYPAEVEQRISEHAKVAQVAVVGLPDEKWGERVTAVVVPRQDQQIDEEEIINFSRETLSGYKIPRQVIQADGLPIGPTGKVLKRDLVEQYSASQ